MKVLIVSFHFPPMNVIASRRAEAYAKYLHKYGIKPTIITHIWEPVKKSSDNFKWKEHAVDTQPIIENYEEYKVIRLPRYVGRKQRIINTLLKLPVVNKLSRFILYSMGHFEHEFIYSYDVFKEFLEKYLTQNSYDAVLPIFSPHSHIRLGYDLNKKLGLPFLADYRDLWDNRIMNESLIERKIERFKNNQAKKWHRKWLKHCCMHSIVSAPWLEKLNELTLKEGGLVITNGYENEIFENNLTEISKDYFYLTHTGKVYKNQDYSYFFRAINIFIERLDDEEKKKIKVRYYLQPNFANHDLFRNNIPKDNLELNTWIHKEEVVVRLKESAILFFPGWSQIRGWYPGKLFEYLGAQRNIVITPSDNSVEQELIEYCNAGICSSDVYKVSDFLYERFLEWKRDKACRYNGIQERIYEFSREMQVKKWADSFYTVIKTNEKGSEFCHI